MSLFRSIELQEASCIRQICNVDHSVCALKLKRIVDIVLSLVALVCVWPLLVVAGVAIVCTSPGPVFYRGIRCGLFGKPFRIIKLRTMVVNAERLGGPTTGTCDYRVTRVGAFLRKCKYDELPQFINVLVGHMSLVGPRPEVLEYTDRYVGDEKLILCMRPGITDFASIEFADLDDRVGSEDPDGYYRRAIMPLKGALRIRYVKEWSLGSDFRILFKTMCKVGRRMIAR